VNPTSVPINPTSAPANPTPVPVNPTSAPFDSPTGGQQSKSPSSVIVPMIEDVMYEDITDKQGKYISYTTGKTINAQSLGFSIVFAEDLLAPNSFNENFLRGRLYGICIKISPDEGIFSCRLDFHFYGGTVNTSGSIRLAGNSNFAGDSSRLAIVGGTGRFEGVSGSILHFWRQDNGNVGNIQISFTFV